MLTLRSACPIVSSIAIVKSSLAYYCYFIILQTYLFLNSFSIIERLSGDLCLMVNLDIHNVNFFSSF